MTQLVVHLFPVVDRAEHAAQQLTCSPDGDDGVDDAAVVSWPADALRPTAWQVRSHRRQGLSGAFWGLLFAHLFLLPLSRLDLSTDPAFVADHSMEHLGISADLLDTVRRSVHPGGSALFVLGHDTATMSDDAAVIRVGPTAVQSARLRAGFGESG